MIRLPFKTSPRGFEKITLGDSTIGEIEIPKMEDLSPNERVYIREQTKEYPDLRKSAVTMARAIAQKSGMKLMTVYEALTGGNTELLGDYLEEFVEFQDLMERTTAHRRLVMATAILKYRLLPEWEIQNTGDAEQIHPKLVDAIADFAQKEESGWKEAERVSEEDLGKSATGETKTQTGQPSTGESITTGKETSDLVLSGSDSNQLG